MSKPLTAQRLRKTNIYAGILHFVQMAAVLALSSDFSLPVTATYMSGPPGSTYAPPVTLFETPIGLDRIGDFPNGFVRDAGIEYFLPYLVQLTPGPNGRQATRNNIAVIGMDPYGFDVAIKKHKVNDDQQNKSRNY